MISVGFVKFIQPIYRFQLHSRHIFIKNQLRNMKTYVQVLTGSTEEHSPCLLLHFDSTRYLFNCGEGTQRVITELGGVKMGRLKHIFLTRSNWECMGGVPGMILTMSDAGSPGITLHGHERTLPLIASMKSFINRPQFDFDVNILPAGGSDTISFSDENIKVKAIPLHSNSSQERIIDETNLKNQDFERYRDIIKRMFLTTGNSRRSASPPKEKKIRSEAKEKFMDGEFCQTHDLDLSEDFLRGKISPLKQRSIEGQVDTAPRNPKSSCYIVEGPVIPRKFDADKAKNLGIPKGKIRSQLVNGESVQLSDGTVVHSHDVCSEPKLGSIFMVVDVPDSSYLHNFDRNDPKWSWIKTKANGSSEDSQQLKCIFHIHKSKATLEDQVYQDWIRSFGDSVKHIVFSPDITPKTILYESSALDLVKLNSFDPQTWHVPHHPDVEEPDLKTKSGFERAEVHLGQPLLKLSLEPSPCFIDKSEEINWKNWDLIQQNFVEQPRKFYPEIREVDSAGSIDFIEKCKGEIFRKKIDACEFLMKNRKLGNEIINGTRLPVISFLGTGSMMPSKYRNVSGILLEIPDESKTENDKSFIIMDPGEGSYGQLLRLSGFSTTDPLNNGVGQVLKNLKIIFVSHMHADHHLGLLRLIEKRNELLNSGESALENPLLVIGPRHLKYFLESYGSQIFRSFEATGRTDGKNDLLLNNMNILFQDASKSGLSNANDDILSDLPKEFPGLKSINTSPVVHCQQAYAINLTFQKEVNDKKLFSVVYSGDTRPCEGVIGLSRLYGKEAYRVLIHESTYLLPLKYVSYDDEELEQVKREAKQRQHCTSSETLAVAQEGRVDECILTHFSQRYSMYGIVFDEIFGSLTSDELDLSNLEKLSSKISSDDCKVFIASDFMVHHVGQSKPMISLSLESLKSHERAVESSAKLPSVTWMRALSSK